EDVIRDATVTGVQTCALPISDVRERGRALGRRRPVVVGHGGGHPADRLVGAPAQQPPEGPGQPTRAATSPERAVLGAGERRRPRSEERRVGKGSESREGRGTE